MNRADPFTGYTILLRVIIYGLVPAYGVLQFFRARRALHVFQLEGYKRARFLEWCRAHRNRALFLKPASAKKPLVMTGRAWRILIASTSLCVVLVLVPSGLAHLYLGGAPADLITWAVMTAVGFFLLPQIVVLADVLLAPVQASINGRYLRSARKRLQEVAPTVVGVTGSFGKTSTKFAIQALLGGDGSVLATPGSFNTPMGICRTINENLGSDHRFFVVEMGAYKEGEIAELCRFVRPSIGVLTAIGPAHLERFGSIEAIERAKYEIVTSLPPDGIAVMNVDDERVRKLADATTDHKVVRYGLDPAGSPDVTASDMRVTPEGTRLQVIVDGSRVGEASTQLLGRHAVGHILAAVSVGWVSGMRLPELLSRIESLQPVEHRLQLIEGTGGVVVIDDAFNSNPEGASAALDVLASMPGGKKVLVTPGIIELGDLQAAANRELGAKAGDVADVIIVVARVNRDAIVSGASGGTARVISVDSLAEATVELQGLLGPGDVVLFENDLPDQYEG